MAVRNRTAQCNRIHGLLLEYGVESPKGVGTLRRRGPDQTAVVAENLGGGIRKTEGSYPNVEHVDGTARARWPMPCRASCRCSNRSARRSSHTRTKPRCGTTPVLIETFVETPRYTGAVYRASGWTRVGATQGRGRYDTEKRYGKPKKDIWLRPLRKDSKRVLNR